MGPGPEFDAIRSVLERLGPAAGSLGDDCALLDPPAATLVLSTDATIEDVHFRRSWLAPHELGWRAAARALSDLAGEGAEPLGVLVAVTTPPDAPAGALAELMSGAGEAAASVGARVLGGDLAAGKMWHLVVTVVGAAARPVTRAGAQPGDELWVTGELGASRAAVDAWLAGNPPDPSARTAFARPMPRVAAGRALAAAGARAMLDVSDGLGGDARHLAAASGVKLVIDVERLPVASAVRGAAGAEPGAAVLYAAAGGDDYELLAAMPPGLDRAMLAAAAGTALTCIGRVEQGAGAEFLLRGRPVQPAGWDHFR